MKLLLLLLLLLTTSTYLAHLSHAAAVPSSDSKPGHCSTTKI